MNVFQTGSTVVPPFWPWLKRIGDQKHPDQLSGGCQIFGGRGSNLGLYICRKEGPIGPNVKRILIVGKKRKPDGFPPLVETHTGSVAERSKALVLGTSLLGGVGSNPTAAKEFWIFSLIPTLLYLHTQSVVNWNTGRFFPAEFDTNIAHVKTLSSIF